MYVLEISGLSKSFSTHLSLGRAQVLHEVTFAVEAGEIFGLLGANGAGKTTTLKTVVGLLRPERGSVRLFGLPPADARARARLGYLPENPHFYDYLTAREFMDFYARLFNLPAEVRAARTQMLLERVGLAGRSDLPLRKFSKGMVQRLGLAQALINDPDLVILDEPMSGLDPIGRREVRDLILDLRRNGKTVLFSSHILSDAELLVDRVAILREGRVTASGRLQALVSDRPRFWELTLSGVPLAALTVPLERVWERGQEFLVRVFEAAHVDALVDEVRRRGGRIVSLVPQRQTLEDVFLNEVRGGRPAEAEQPPATAGETAGRSRR
jgi:ABC-2 type transport system ATP-binding protein